jgi:hypothetical protein
VVKITAAADKPDAKGRQVVTVTLAIDKPWHLYANPVGPDDLTSAQTELTVAGKAKLVKADYPKGVKVEDTVVGTYMTYEGKVEIKLTVERPAGDAGPLELVAKFMACEFSADGKAGRCLLPAKVPVKMP